MGFLGGTEGGVVRAYGLGTVGGGKGSQIGGEQGAQGVDGDVAVDDGAEVGGIGKAFTINLHDAIKADFLKALGRHGALPRGVGIENGTQGVAIGDVRTGIAVGQEGALAIHQTSECFFVAARLREIEVGQLHKQGEVGLRRGGRYALGLF